MIHGFSGKQVGWSVIALHHPFESVHQHVREKVDGG
jgi:hypothetical protein